MHLSEILSAREARWNQKCALAKDEKCAVVSVTLRMPVKLRLSEDAKKVLLRASEEIFSMLKASFENASLKGEFDTADGPYALFTSGGKAEAIKTALVRFEETSACGDLIDADVMTEAGEEVSRIAVGGRERTCLVCGKNAARICAKSNAHTREETIGKIRNILKNRLV